MSQTNPVFQIQAIGKVQRDQEQITARIDPIYRAALKGLEGFSHVIVYWWADRFDSTDFRQTLQVPLPYASDVEAGVFACRSPIRPNTLMSTVCEIIHVDHDNGHLLIKNIDAFHDTPIIDLKPYFPIVDRVQEVRIPYYAADWPQWMPADGIGLMEGES